MAADGLTRTEKIIWTQLLDITPNLSRIAQESGVDYSRVKRIYKQGGMKVYEMEQFLEFIHERGDEYDF